MDVADDDGDVVLLPAAVHLPGAGCWAANWKDSDEPRAAAAPLPGPLGRSNHGEHAGPARLHCSDSDTSEGDHPLCPGRGATRRECERERVRERVSE